MSYTTRRTYKRDDGTDLVVTEVVEGHIYSADYARRIVNVTAYGRYGPLSPPRKPVVFALTLTAERTAGTPNCNADEAGVR